MNRLFAVFVLFTGVTAAYAEDSIIRCNVAVVGSQKFKDVGEVSLPTNTISRNKTVALSEDHSISFSYTNGIDLLTIDLDGKLLGSAVLAQIRSTVTGSEFVKAGVIRGTSVYVRCTLIPTSELILNLEERVRNLEKLQKKKERETQ